MTPTLPCLILTGEAGPQLMSSSPAHVMKLNSFLYENARPPMPFMVETAKSGRPGSVESPGSHKEDLLRGDGGHVHHPEDQSNRLSALGRDSRSRQWLVPCTRKCVCTRVCVHVSVWSVCVSFLSIPLLQSCLNEPGTAWDILR